MSSKNIVGKEIYDIEYLINDILIELDNNENKNNINLKNILNYYHKILNEKLNIYKNF
jgi:hypothetical protein